MSSEVRDITKRETELEYAFSRGISLESRTIVISGEINERTFRRVSMALTELEALNRKSITIEINSEGGEVYQALAVIGRMKNSPCKLTTIGYGQVMSAASVILAAGDERIISKYAWVMVHEGSAEVGGKVADMIEFIRQCRREEEQWARIMEDLTATPKSAWLEMCTKDTYLTPDQCLQLGLVDRIR